MKKLFIMGAGKGQLPIIKLANKMGYETIVGSIPGDYPGINQAKKFREVDITNKEQVLKVAQEEAVDGIVADQIDIAVPTVAYVAEKMELEGIGYDCALKFTDKFYMRNECSKININMPVYYKINKIEEAINYSCELGFPFMIKPIDGAGSKGVSLVYNENDLYEKFDIAYRSSKSKSVIIEQFIEGNEYVVEGFASNYQYTNLAIGKRDYFDIPGKFIPKSTLFRQPLSDVEQEIFNVNSEIVNHFELKFGVTHGEYIVEKLTGKIYLVEIAARGGGVNTSSDLIPLATGLNINQQYIKLALGEEQYIEIDNMKDNAAAYLSFLLPKGKVTYISGVDEVKSIPNVQDVHLDELKLGLKINSPNDKSARQGPILIKGKNPDEIKSIMKQIKKLLHVTVDTPTGTKDIIW